MKRTAYIAGLPTENVMGKFDIVASDLAKKGYNVVKPVALSDDSAAWDAAVRNDIRKMLSCDDVHMLPDWQDSRSAQLERDIALRLGIAVVYH